MADTIYSAQREYRAARVLLDASKRRLTARIRAMFDECDKDDSGHVSAGEFVGRVLQQTSGTEYEALRNRLREQVRVFRTLDRDRDHLVSLDEMMAFFMSHDPS